MSKNTPPIQIGIPLYPNFDSLDVLGPYQTFYMQDPVLETKLVGADKSPVTSFEGVSILPQSTFDSAPQFDVLFVPGGVNFEKMFDRSKSSQAYIDFVSRQAKGAKLVTSVCTGALLLAAAGGLDGYQATTHWGYTSVLRLFPRVIVADGYPRYVIDGNRVTGGGIASGLDESMAIVSMLLGEDAAKRGQLIMQYEPRPPFHSGDPTVAQPPILYQVSSNLHPSAEAMSAAVLKYLGSGKHPAEHVKGASRA
jgi:cyclohexyl-isocyanide hydratase